MKKSKLKVALLPLLTLLMCACLLCGGLTSFSARADVSYTPANGYTTTNVARGKTTRFVDKDGTDVPSDKLSHLHGETGWDPYEALTDGDCQPGAGHNIVRVAKQCFAVIDLEDTYTVTGLGLSFWNNHSIGYVVAQIASKPDFSDAITLYNCDTINHMGQGGGFDSNIANNPTKLVNIAHSPVRGRYVRVTGISTTNGAVMFSEIAVYGVTEGLVPVSGNVANTYLADGKSLTLYSEYEGAQIRYTTDGTIPTENSALYTAPLNLADIGYSKVHIRAVAVLSDGRVTMPSDFKYDIRSRNLMAGLTPTFNDEKYEIYNRYGTGKMSQITDGGFDPVNVPGLRNKEDGSLAIGWLYFDLGAEYKVDKAVFQGYHNWAHHFVYQISTTADFSDGNYTVYNSLGKNGWLSYTDEVEGMDLGRRTDTTWFRNAKTVEFTPVTARYVRVLDISVENASRGSVWEEIQLWSAVKPASAYSEEAENLAFGLVPTFDEGYEAGIWQGSANTDSITDNVTSNPTNVMALKNIETGNLTAGWLYLDLGAEYKVDTVKAKFWHDWAFGAIIQLSTSKDFTTGNYTVYSNRGNGSGVWNDYGDAAKNFSESTTTSWYFGYQTFEFDAVSARYLRVFCVSASNATRYSVWEEIQVWRAAKEGTPLPEEQFPVAERAIVKAGEFENTTVPNGYEISDLADKLPATLTVEDYFGNGGTVTGEWTCADYDGNTQGDYIFAFTPAAGSEYIDLYNILKIKITVAEAADKTALAAEIAKADALHEDDYLPDTWAGLPEALQEAKTVNGQNKLFQADVDKAQRALSAAISKLVARGDKTNLKAELAAIAELNEQDYSSASWATFAEKVTAANAVNSDINATQDAVDLALNELVAAREALKKLGDKTQLETLYNQVKDTQNIYTQATWVPFADALSDAKEIIERSEVYEDEVTRVYNALNSAHGALTEKADFSALETAVAEAEEVDLGGYTASSVAAFTAALNSAKEVLADDENTQSTIDAAVAALAEKKAALAAKGDAAVLTELITKCNYAPGNYTASSYNAYTVAKQKAEAVRDNPDASQTEINEAKTELEAAVKNLVKLAYKSELNDAIAEAEQITENGYTAASFEAFTKMLEYAKSVALSNDVSQETVDDAVTQLKAAQKALVKAKKKGCGGNLGGFGSATAAVLLIAATAVIAKRKRFKAGK